MGKYDYDKPLTSQEVMNIERNRDIVKRSLKQINENPNLADGMPMPTTPMSSQEVMTMVHNIKLLECERKKMAPFYNRNENYNKASESNDNSKEYTDTEGMIALIKLFVILGILCFMFFKLGGFSAFLPIP